MSVLRRGDPGRRDQVPVLLQRPPGRPRHRDAATAGAGRRSRRGAVPTAFETSAPSDTVTPPTGDRQAHRPLRPCSTRTRATATCWATARTSSGSGIGRDPAARSRQFPRTDEGWRSAWIRFVSLEPEPRPGRLGAGSIPHHRRAAAQPGCSHPAARRRPTSPTTRSSSTPIRDRTTCSATAGRSSGSGCGATRPGRSSGSRGTTTGGRRVASLHDDRVELRRGRPRKLGLRVARWSRATRRAPHRRLPRPARRSSSAPTSG